MEDFAGHLHEHVLHLQIVKLKKTKNCRVKYREDDEDGEHAHRQLGEEGPDEENHHEQEGGGKGAAQLRLPSALRAQHRSSQRLKFNRICLIYNL